MPGLEAGIHDLSRAALEDADGRDKPDHDKRGLVDGKSASPPTSRGYGIFGEVNFSMT
ncbi:MAG: hypothetical protein V3S93_05670 [Methyloceanibacter sp.]|jgi:hypothetical protein